MRWVYQLLDSLRKLVMVVIEWLRRKLDHERSVRKKWLGRDYSRVSFRRKPFQECFKLRIRISSHSLWNERKSEPTPLLDRIFRSRSIDSVVMDWLDYVPLRERSDDCIGCHFAKEVTIVCFFIHWAGIDIIGTGQEKRYGMITDSSDMDCAKKHATISPPF